MLDQGNGRREQAKIELPVRIIHAIYMAAMRDCSGDEDAYLEGKAQAVAEALEAECDGAKLKALISEQRECSRGR